MAAQGAVLFPFACQLLFGSPSSHALFNIEGALALTVVALLFLADRAPTPPFNDPPIQLIWAGPAMCGLVFVLYWRVLSMPFLFDDFTHITDVSRFTWGTVLREFERQPGPAPFFRPFGSFTLWIEFLGSGLHPGDYHAVSLALHSANCCLVFALATALGCGRFAAATAAALFAINGAAVETVAWIDSRGDLIATLLSLAALLALCRYNQSRRRVWLVAAVAAALLAGLTKESAFALPLMAACLFFFPLDRRRLSIASSAIGAAITMLFAYRWWAIHGLGGYAGSHLQILRSLEGLGVRLWALLVFPVNWSDPLPLLATLLIVLPPLVLAFAAPRCSASRRMLLGCLLLSLAAAIPVHNLLLFDKDFAGARYLYLPSVGWTMLLGCFCSGLVCRRSQALLLAWLICLHVVLLNHNLAPWLEVPNEAQTVCRDFANQIGDRSVTVRGLPQKKRGVVFLANGFPQCVELNGGLPGRVTVTQSPHADYVWSERRGRLVPAD